MFESRRNSNRPGTIGGEEPRDLRQQVRGRDRLVGVDVPDGTGPVERWLPIVGWEGFYEVSDLGRVRSIARDVKYNGRWGVTHRRFPPRMLKPLPIWDGHLRVALVGDGERHDRRIHVLVLDAFVGPRPEGMLGCHRDGDPANNHPSNLYWGTHSSNGHDAVRHGNHHNAAKETCPRDHPLVVPNLMPSHMKHGHRSCLACARATCFARKRGIAVGDPEFKPIADRYYEQIMRDAP